MLGLSFIDLRMLGELGLALLLSTLIGWEREFRAKSAGMRTHTLVGVGSALFMLVSKYGFNSVLGEHVVLDPSRVAAQIVSGIGFIGGGLIFVRRDAVRGLTTAATVWVTAGVGMACGGGLVLLACAATAIHFLVVLGYPALGRLAPSSRTAPHRVRIAYEDSRGVLRRAMDSCTRRGWEIIDLEVEREDPDSEAHGGTGVAVVALRVRGRAPVRSLVEQLSALPGVLHVVLGNAEDPMF